TDNNGKGEAFSPTDLVSAALGSCALTIMGMYASTHGLNMTGATAEVNKTMASGPRRISAVEVMVKMPAGDYPDRHKKGLELAARGCPVLQSLHPDTEKKLTIIWP
ncbi:MAG: OsmC family protein, partial [Deltaproteobacteria bacterium]|nr:OsmC family protein [Deltaproteobacteria bacterium]